MTRVEEVLRRITDITAAQRRLIRETNTDALERNLERRQACIDELAAIPDREEQIAASEEAKRLLGELQSMERENLALMKDGMSAFREKMRRTNEAKKINAYYQPMYVSDDSGYFDNKK